MKTTQILGLAAALGLGACGLTLTGCDNDSAAENAAEKVEDAVDDAGDAAGDAIDDAGDAVDKAANELDG